MKIFNDDPANLDKQFSRKQPCAECPFSRACAPGGTGGADPTVYVGQAYGAFYLPCHMDANYNPKEAVERSDSVAQCAGAAVFRTHVGVGGKMPPVVHRLPANTARIFANPAELIAHHLRISTGEAEAILIRTPPEELLRIEVGKLDDSHRLLVRNRPAEEEAGEPARKAKERTRHYRLDWNCTRRELHEFFAAVLQVATRGDYFHAQIGEIYLSVTGADDECNLYGESLTDERTVEDVLHEWRGKIRVLRTLARLRHASDVLLAVRV